MKTKYIVLAVLLALFCGHRLFAQESVEVLGRAYLGQLNLEGPALTGPDDVEGEDVDGYGFVLEGRVDLKQGWFVQGVLDWASWDERFYIVESRLGLGKEIPLRQSPRWDLGMYVLPALEYLQLEGIDTYRDEPRYAGRGSFEDGSSLGFSLEAALLLNHASGLSAELYGKYLAFDGGDGPAFGLRLKAPLTDSWKALLSWDGVWVEDHDDFPIDLAHQKLSLGLLRRF